MVSKCVLAKIARIPLKNLIFTNMMRCTRVKHHANPETVDDPYFYYETVKRTIASCPHRDK